MPEGRPTNRRSAATPTSQAVLEGIEIELVRKRVKHLNLRVYPPDGRVRLTVPYGTSEPAIREAVRARANWIRSHQARFRAMPQPASTLYVSGETHYVAGVPHRLRLELGTRRRVHLQHDHLVMQVTPSCNRAARHALLEAWHRQKVKERLPQLVHAWSERMQVLPPEFRVKRMSTRWGSCNPRARRIWLNLALALRRPALLEYVVVHELAHLLVADHGPSFKALMTQHMPGWRRLDAELDEWPIWARTPPPAG